MTDKIKVSFHGKEEYVNLPFYGVQKCNVCGKEIDKIINDKEGLIKAFNFDKIHSDYEEGIDCNGRLKFTQIYANENKKGMNLAGFIKVNKDDKDDSDVWIEYSDDIENLLGILPQRTKGDGQYLKQMHDIANLLVEKYKIITISAKSLRLEEMWVWQNGYYNKKGESVLHTMILQPLSKLNKYDFNTVIEYIKAAGTRKDRSEVQQKRYVVNLENGILDYSSGEVVFIPRKNETDFYDYNFGYIINVKYDKGAKCPIINKILKDVLDDKDAIIYQYIGFCFFTEYSIKESAVVLAGRPNSGKTTVLNPITQFLGKANICAVSIQNTDPKNNKFATQHMDEKLANIVDEMPYISPKNIEIFKATTGGADIYLESKYKDGYITKITTKSLFTANELFKVKDDIAESFFSRIKLVTCDKTFEVDSDETNDKYKDMVFSDKELSGLLNSVIGGMQKLLKNKKFDGDEDTEEIWEEYRQRTNQTEIQIGEFLADCTQEVSESWIRQPFLYKYYKLYCSINKIVSVGKKTFSKILKEHGHITYNTTVKDKQFYAYKGIRLNGFLENYFRKKFPTDKFCWEHNDIKIILECNKCKYQRESFGNANGLDKIKIEGKDFECDNCGEITKFLFVKVYEDEEQFNINELDDKQKSGLEEVEKEALAVLFL